MRKKFKTFINLFVLLFVIFYPIKSSASSYKCDLFLDALNANYLPEYNYIPGNVYFNDFGYSRLYKWDEANKKWHYRKDDNGNYMVGKIHRLDLAQHIKSGNSIISLNGQKFVYDEKQIELLQNSDEIKIEFFDDEKGNFVLDLKKQEELVADVLFDLEDISVNKIDIKEGIFELRLQYDVSYIFEEEFHKKLYAVADGTILFKTDDGKWHWDVCNFTEKEFVKSRLADPGNEIKLLNLAKKDKDLSEVDFRLTPYNKKIGNPGNSLYLEKKIGGVFAIKNKFNLRAFPFDKQKLSLSFIDDRYTLDKRQIIASRNTFESLNDYLKKDDISGWNVTSYEINPFQYQDEFFQKRNFADGLTLDISIERKHGYYIFKVILPIILILMVCWSVVWIHPRELESRLTITIVCLLSLIAYNFVIDAELPKLEYLTVLDWIILFSYFYAAVPNFLTIASFRFIKTNEQLSMKLENYGKKYGPTSYVAIIIFIIFLNANLNPENASALISWMSGR